MTMRIGVPKEIKNHEYRVGLTPAGAHALTLAGHEVVVETNAGARIGFADADYVAAGARIASNAAEAYGQADMVVKVKELQAAEFPLTRPGQLLFAYQHFAPDPDLLLAPTRLYVNELRAVADAGVPVNAAAHITGGGLPENLPRALPEGLGAVVDAGTWDRGPAFDAILSSGRVDADDAWRTFNMGIGMCLIVPAERAGEVAGVVADARVIGRVEAGVDGVQGVGALPVPLDGIDALAVGGHKWLCGSEGAGFLYVAPRLLERLQPFNVSWHSVAEDLSVPGAEIATEAGVPALKASAERFEEGTPNAFGNIMLGEAMAMLTKLGAATIAARHRELQDLLVEGLRGKGYRVVSSLRDGERSGILSFDRPGDDPDALVSALKQDQIICLRRGDAVRLSPHFYNNADDVARAIAALPD